MGKAVSRREGPDASGSYPFSERYGWLEDKYGLSWQLIWAGGMEIAAEVDARADVRGKRVAAGRKKRSNSMPRCSRMLLLARGAEKRQRWGSRDMARARSRITKARYGTRIFP